MHELLSLSRSELAELAAAIRTGRVTPPYTATSLGRFVSVEHVSRAIAGLQACSAVSMNAMAIATVLDLLASNSASRSPLDELIDLVITGPTPNAVGRDTAVVVSELFRRARQTVIVVGYAVSKGREVFRTLAARMDEEPNLHVRLYLDIQRSAGDTSADTEIVQRFIYRFVTTQWPEGARLPEIYYDPRALSVDRVDRAALHAKCVVIDDQEVFVSSANFTEYAQERNIEIGLSLRSRQVAHRIATFLAELAECGQLRPALHRRACEL
jgi:phosphatidylserine/phosphatidylglycerophosphate/cardiolipin synthase-like enzyme